MAIIVGALTMSDQIQLGELISAVANVLAGLVTAAAAFGVARYSAIKQRIEFVIYPPRGLLMAKLRRIFKGKLNNMPKACEVVVANVGNKVVRDLTFDIVVPEKGTLVYAEPTSGSEKLRSEVKIHPSHASLSVVLGFLNSNEGFGIRCLFEGPAARCKVLCRLPDVTTTIMTNYEFWRRKVVAYLTVVAISSMGLVIAQTTSVSPQWAPSIIILLMGALSVFAFLSPLFRAVIVLVGSALLAVFILWLTRYWSPQPWPVAFIAALIVGIAIGGVGWARQVVKGP